MTFNHFEYIVYVTSIAKSLFSSIFIAESNKIVNSFTLWNLFDFDFLESLKQFADESLFIDIGWKLILIYFWLFFFCFRTFFVCWIFVIFWFCYAGCQ